MNTLNLDNHPPASMTVQAIDITLDNFTTEIIEASRSQLVIVLFWSPKSSASASLERSLTPSITESKGAAKLAKIDVSKYPQIAQQMHVQQVPAVYAFWQGQPVDGFMGAIPEAQAGRWLLKLIQTTGATSTSDNRRSIEKAIEQAEDFLQQGDIATAQSIFEDLSTEFPEDPAVIAGCITCMAKTGKLDDAKKLITNLPDKIKLISKVQSSIATYELAEQAVSTKDNTEKWLSELKENPDNHGARFDYAMYLYANNQTETAVDQLLEIVRRNRSWQDEKARKQVVKIFESLGPMHEITLNARRKLSAILFS